ncbi:cytochrome P450 [Guyanagaster necrorhizus]|uniref:Cytochrome P450 n=1 Tax=Guyanagaster necrorhizus TaxID=856835 RepID=A0A9P8APF7_9AGAR|nr:cytochrome P450 [Guyanagaster necrorhizus MCA 3950]KAG7441817.1 cytochrome P450 [Guyanagaster necrorhizus MCA 3950]
MSPSPSYLFSTLILLVLVAIRAYIFTFRRLSLPPGPRGSFFLGVKNRLASSAPWKQYAQWASHYGSSVISFLIYNRRVIVLNDSKSVHDLLDKRANIYSDRPKAWMYHEICARGKSVFNISSLDSRHKQYRRLLQEGVGAMATLQYSSLLDAMADMMVEGFIDSPEKYVHHLRRNSAAVIMKVAYGYTVTENDDFIKVAEESAMISAQTLAPGRWLVDYYPIVRFLPSWLPFAGFKRQGAEWKQRLDSLSGVPHEWVKKQMALGRYTESFTSRLLNAKSGSDPEGEDIIKWCAGGLYAGAADTTVSAMISFLMLMARYSQVQERAQAEIDDVIGRVDSPRTAVLSKLVYLPAVLKEILRFAPVANLALPHKVVCEDTYGGFRIPKDATIIANVWAIMHDPQLYPKPFEFDPSRFADTSHNSLSVNPDPRQFAFGYGRRTCPGIQFAEVSMLLSMANILSKFTIACTEQFLPEIEFSSGITSHVKPFGICITPRT